VRGCAWFCLDIPRWVGECSSWFTMTKFTTSQDSKFRRMKVPHKSILSIWLLIILIQSLLMGCRSSSLPTATPDPKAIQTQIVPQETVTTSYYQTKAAQFLAQATDNATGGVLGNENFPHAPCVISALVVAVLIGIYARSRRKK
jgi:hypothetical protein